ncbi:MAG: alpha/beta hydrolase, partial [Planctomycetes bacterium]|nr:alpha/beta hydrolase [Planctomycetota bacterium]
HTTYDPGVPPYLSDCYALTASLQGCEKWFVQMRVEADGHCNIAPDLVGKAFDQLRAWAKNGERAKPGLLR